MSVPFRSNPPRVSVITPVMNRADTIDRCVLSVSAQTYPSVEHIVVDGGSTDGTIQRLKGLEAEYPLTWISEPDRGMYDAINKGLALAQGEVFAYLNSDDLYFPWTLEVAVENLLESDLIYGDLAVIARRANGTNYVYLQFYPKFNMNYYTHVATLGQPTVAWRRSLTEEIGPFDIGYRLLGDCEYWLRAASSGATLAHINEVTAVQVDHSATLRQRHPGQLSLEFERLRNRYGEVAGPPGNPKLQRFKRSLRWRGSQLRLRAAIRSPNPRRWAHFVRFMRTSSVKVDTGRLLLFLLPARLRPGSATWADPDVFERKLLKVLGAPKHVQ